MESSSMFRQDQARLFMTAQHPKWIATAHELQPHFPSCFWSTTSNHLWSTSGATFNRFPFNRQERSQVRLSVPATWNEAATERWIQPVAYGTGSDASYIEKHQTTEGSAAKPVPPAHQAWLLPRVCISLLFGVSSLQKMTKQALVYIHLHASPPQPHSVLYLK